MDPSAKIIFGAYHDRKMKAGQIKVTIVATGFSGTALNKPSASLSNLFNTPVEKRPESTYKKEEMMEEAKPKPKTEMQKKSSDVWDIPTFLRKKKR